MSGQARATASELALKYACTFGCQVSEVTVWALPDGDYQVWHAGRSDLPKWTTGTLDTIASDFARVSRRSR